MTAFDTVAILRQAFPDLAEEALRPLAEMTQERAFGSGELICREGAFEDKFYIIGAGTVEFTKRFMADEERQLRTGGPGVYFGEMALLQEEARSANVRTLSDVTVLEIDKASFQQAIQSNPAMMLDIVRTLIQRMRANDATALEEMRQQKEEIKAAYDELRHQEELRTEFLTTLAHELRTPLASSSGYMQLVEKGMMTGPALQMSLGKIRTNLDRVISLVNDLLFVQEQELIEPSLRPVSVRALLDVVADDLRDDAEDQNTYIKIEVPPNLPAIQADPDGLVRAFNELLENAIKFSPDGGDVTVMARQLAKGVDVDFIDEGVGISEAFMPRLFKRFERTERIGDHLFDGVGLGLAIAKHIIESHGGAITVQSTAGQGSTFTIHLPYDGGRTQLRSPGEIGAQTTTTSEPEIASGDTWVDVGGDDNNSAR
ncbi:MAG: cyclic nucleotide-binding domain-containing protein [Chloroflexi bacterium]|nr:cyclic nucleotide-binding domain-containing protein [Chloroflexota bacterium]